VLAEIFTFQQKKREVFHTGDYISTGNNHLMQQKYRSYVSKLIMRRPPTFER
jgi:hypothetical protein